MKYIFKLRTDKKEEDSFFYFVGYVGEAILTSQNRGEAYVLDGDDMDAGDTVIELNDKTFPKELWQEQGANPPHIWEILQLDD